jgi:hypothetical protein
MNFAYTVISEEFFAGGDCLPPSRPKTWAPGYPEALRYPILRGLSRPLYALRRGLWRVPTAPRGGRVQRCGGVASASTEMCRQKLLNKTPKNLIKGDLMIASPTSDICRTFWVRGAVCRVSAASFSIQGLGHAPH